VRGDGVVLHRPNQGLFRPAASAAIRRSALSRAGCSPNSLLSAMAVAQDQTSGAASHFGFVSLPHFLGSSLCIFSISRATSGWFSMTCFVMAFTISSQDPADSFWSHFPPRSLRDIVFTVPPSLSDFLEALSVGAVALDPDCSLAGQLALAITSAYIPTRIGSILAPDSLR